MSWRLLSLLLLSSHADSSETSYMDTLHDEGDDYRRPGAPKLIEDVDRNNDGRISKDELWKRLHRMKEAELAMDAEVPLNKAYLPPDDPHVLAEFNNVDTDDDGSISELEAVNAVVEDAPLDIAEDAEAAAQHTRYQELTADHEVLRFHAADSNEDGKLSLREFSSFRSKLCVLSP